MRLYAPDAITFRIVAAAPEFFTRVDALLGRSLDHRLPAERTGGRSTLNALLCAIGQSFCRETLCETALLSESVQLPFYLTVQHHDESVAKD